LIFVSLTGTAARERIVKYQPCPSKRITVRS
jgi:hypothetical protein